MRDMDLDHLLHVPLSKRNPYIHCQMGTTLCACDQSSLDPVPTVTKNVPEEVRNMIIHDDWPVLTKD